MSVGQRRAAAGTALDLAPDPQQCNQYVKDIYGHLRVLEGEFRVSPAFYAVAARHQRDDARHPHRLAVVEVAEEYRLVPETLHLSVNYIDRFLAQHRADPPPPRAAAAVAAAPQPSLLTAASPPPRAAGRP